MQADFFARLAQQSQLGPLVKPAVPVTGGFLHKMYRMETITGVYAVKLLDMRLFDNPETEENYRRAEQLEDKLFQAGLPVVAALTRNGRKRQTLDGQQYYVFPWIDGHARPWGDITAFHCQAAGELLGRVHGVETRPGSPDRTPFSFDWSTLASRAWAAGSPLADALLDALPLLISAQGDYNAALRSLPDGLCICNSDMDSKNVLWEGNRPYIIDLECLEYGSALQDVMVLALSWSGGVTCALDADKLQAFFQGYERVRGPLKADMKALWGLGFAWLDWLRHCVEQALDSSRPAQERTIGEQEARNTIGRIVHHRAMQEPVFEKMGW